MGYMRHNAIIVSSSIDDLFYEAHKKATEIFPWVSPISPLAMNGVRSFFIPPDGSKEGWNDSNEGDERREAFKEFLNSKRWDDGSTSLDWVEIQYGDDQKQTLIVDHSDSI